VIKPTYDLIGWTYNKEIQELVKTTSKGLLSHSTPLAIQQPIGGANEPIATDPVLWVFATEMGAAVTENMCITTSYPLLRTERKTSRQSSSMLLSCFKGQK